MTYGQSVMVTWAARDYYELKDNSGNILVDDSGNTLIGRTDSGIHMKAETSIFDDEKLNADVTGLQITAEGLTSRVSNAEGDISVLDQRADAFDLRVENDEGDIADLQLTAEGLEIDVVDIKGDVETLQGQMATAIDELGNIYELSITTAYTESNITYSAKLVQNGIDISTQGDYSHDFEWFTKSKDNCEYLGCDRTLTISKDSLAYGQSIMLVWTQRDFYSLLDNSDNNLLDNSGNHLVSRSNKPNGLTMKAESSVFDDESLGVDMNEFRVTAEGLTSRVSDAEGNLSVLEQIAKGFRSTVTGNATSTGAISYDSKGNIYRLITDMQYTPISIIYTANIIRNGENISSRSDVTNDFTWYSKVQDSFEYLGYGRTLEIPLEEVNFGISVVCEWTEREYARALDNQGNYLKLNDGSNLFMRAETDYIA